MSAHPYGETLSASRLAIALALCFSLGLPLSSFSNPGGANIRQGDIRIQQGGNALRVIQKSNRGVIDWNSFSIQHGQTTRFVQPNARAATLNRVTGGTVSRIDGNLRANGSIFLLNPNGVLVGRTGVIDVAGFTASTLDISDRDFLSGGDLRYRGDSQAAVVNLGSISAFDGDIFLIASTVDNSGSLSARRGTVGLAAGNDVLIKESGTERVFVRGASGEKKENGVVNEGSIHANIAELKSHGGNLYGMAVKNEGRVAATGVSREGGQIFLRAGGQRSSGSRVRSTGTLVAKNPNTKSGGRVVVESGQGGVTEVGGTIDAAGGETGGEIVLLGREVSVLEGSLIIADGERAGGTIYIGGGRRGEEIRFMNATDVSVAEGVILSANATVEGGGGEVIVFAEKRLDFLGSVSATGGDQGGNGGFVELSGKNEVFIPDLASRVFLGAANGDGGTLLFDPTDIYIFSGTGTGPDASFPMGLNTIEDGDIVSFLGTGANLVIDTNSVDTDAGDITIFSGVDITWSAGGNLSFNADRDFVLENGARIEALGAGSVFVTAGRAAELGKMPEFVTEEGTEPADLPLAGGIKTNTGDIIITANEDGLAFGTFTGVNMVGGALETADGAIELSGHGGNQDASISEANFGVSIFNSFISATGLGSVTIEGTGGDAALGNGDGFSMSSGLIRTHDGDLSITGVGGATTNAVASGIQMQGLFETTGTGSILLSGEGGANIGHGIELLGEARATGSGGIHIKADSLGNAEQGLHLALTTSAIKTADVNSSILIEANSVDFSFGSVSSPGDLIIRPLDPASDIHIGAGASDLGFQVTQSEIDLLADGFRSITIGDTSFGSGSVYVSPVTFRDPTTLAASGVGGEIFVNGQITGADNASITLDGAGPGGLVPNTTYLNSNIVTAGNEIRISDDVVLRSDAILDTTMSGAVVGGADVLIEGTVNSETTAEALTINAGTTGEIDFQGAVGASNAVGNVDLDAGQISIGHSMTSVGDLTVDVTRSAKILPGVSLHADGSITVNANQVTAVSGDFHGIEVAGSLTSTGGQVILVGNGGDSAGNKGVWIHSGSGVSGSGAVTISGNARSNEEVGVAIQAGVQSSNQSVSVSTEMGKIEVGNSVTGNSGVSYTGSSTDDTDFLFSIRPSSGGYTVDGGAGFNSVDFSGHSGGSLYLNADQFSNVDTLTGSASSFDSFEGSSNTGATFTINGSDEFIYDDLNGERISVSSFENASGSDFNDRFIINVGTGNSFAGDLYGRGGSDRFELVSGAAGYISGSYENAGGEDVLDFSGVTVFVGVDLDSMTYAYGGDTSYFSNIERVIGGASGDVIQSTYGNDKIRITGNGSGSITFEETFEEILTDYPASELAAVSEIGIPSEAFTQTIQFESFSEVRGGNGDDHFFVELLGESDFEGILSGESGDDTFSMMPGGSVGTIFGGADFDSLDFGSFTDAVEVDLDAGTATQVGFFSSIEKLAGGLSVDGITGTGRADQITITSGTGGIFSTTVDAGEGATSIREFEFSDFEKISGLGGNDTFFVSIAPGLLLDGALLGGAGNDRFVIAPGGGVSAIHGGADFDTLDYSGFSAPVKVDFRNNSSTSVGSLNGLERLVGGSNTDTLFGTNNADIFRVQSSNAGTLNQGSFSGFEILNGAGGNDQFQFYNQAVVDLIVGGQGNDLLRIDDRTLGGRNTYTIGQDTIVRNPTYTFSGLEALTLLLGGGGDTVVTRSNGLTQILDGGGGEDFLDMGANFYLGGNPIQLGSSRVFASNFEGPNPPSDDSEVILTQQTQNVQVPAPTEGDGAPIDQFSSTTVTPGTFGAFTGSLAAAVAGQAIAIQLDGSQYLLQAPASLDGTFTVPPASIIETLKNNLEPDVWAELANAIDFEGSTILLRMDGPYMINLTEATPAEMAALLQENLTVSGSLELLSALEMTLSIPLVSADGPIGIMTVQVPLPQEVIDMLTDLIGEESFAELNSALEE
ncbi:MAG: filamentous hemagglutinin N-terminal domain-containing protein [Verrucomicrobiales bacterium]|nr:filamentous hemagglutinin N-terminal domain-containing protein [Verrucomicrobiales bacterium]